MCVRTIKTVKFRTFENNIKAHEKRFTGRRKGPRTVRVPNLIVGTDRVYASVYRVYFVFGIVKRCKQVRVRTIVLLEENKNKNKLKKNV